MATISMTRDEAAKKLEAAKVPIDIGGRYHIIDILEALGLLHIREEATVIDVIEPGVVIIKRNGNIIYEE